MTRIPISARPSSPLPHRIGTLLVAFGLAAATAYVLAFNPTDTNPDPTGPCMFHVLFDINGPACGGTRMYWYLIHGDLIQAFRHNPVALIAFPPAAYGLVWWTTWAWSGKRLPALRIPASIYIAYGVIGLVFLLVLRNLPSGPFTWFNIPYLG
ncbi:DUF2752 domain-containing protein [Haloglycomyces albus]|uniref:DUF2752 domain-containing protein n=1 Tax=Haloglycomyces albus TaxID=526067 RepID=UPI00046D29DF|nr:DUF2752 domain-containing protein [Haloglycomyces albus]